MMNKEQVIENLKFLPLPLVGGICWDDRRTFNFRDSCYDMIKDVLEISQPKELLEFGSHLGHSSCIWLSMSQANVTSIDLCNGMGHVEWLFSYADYGVPSNAPGLKYVTEVFNHLFPGRFRFFPNGSDNPETIQKYSDRTYQLLFVDGNHTFEGAKFDCEMGVKLKIPWILVDDYDSSEDIRNACKIPEFELVKEYKSCHNVSNIGLALFKNKNI